MFPKLLKQRGIAFQFLNDSGSSFHGFVEVHTHFLAALLAFRDELITNFLSHNARLLTNAISHQAFGARRAKTLGLVKALPIVNLKIWPSGSAKHYSRCRKDIL
jgi:hypothetical protein